MKVFISCTFDPVMNLPIELVKSMFKIYGIDAFVSGRVETTSLSESIRRHIKESDVFLVILTKIRSDWVQNEIGMAYSEKIPIYAITEDGVDIKGILPHITIYETFSLEKPKSLINAISHVAEKISELSTDKEMGEIYNLLKTKRERTIYKLGIHSAAATIFLLLTIKDISPIFYEIYQKVHEQQREHLFEELKTLTAS